MSTDEVETQIAEWRGYMLRRRAVKEVDVEELEDHLRSTVSELTESGLRSDEAFLVAVKRMGNLDDLSREFARVHSDRLWKQLVLSGGQEAASSRTTRMDVLVLVGCAALAAIGIKLPELFGLTFDGDEGFYQRNIGLFALAPLALYFGIRRRLAPAMIGLVAGLFIVGAVAANAYPLKENSQSIVLTAIHLPLALWLAMGVAYIGGDWRSDRKRMDFIRFTGEWFIYYVLIALGGGVLTGITFGTFEAIGLDIEEFVGQWLVPCGAVAAVIVAAWLVEAKQSVIENMAPVLTRLFTPLFTAALLAFLGAVLWTGNFIDTDRDVLILFDVLLIVVLGLVLYSISARDPLARPGAFDWLQLALVTSALIIDVLALVVITGRLGDEFGTTPNRAMALGVNGILLANLAWTTFLLSDFVRNRRPFAPLERWQTRYLAVYAAWAWIVVLLFPPIFGYV